MISIIMSESSFIVSAQVSTGHIVSGDLAMTIAAFFNNLSGRLVTWTG